MMKQSLNQPATKKDLKDLDLKLGKRIGGVDGRLDGMDKRLDGMDKRLDGMDKRLDGMDKRLDGMDKRLDGMDKRLDTMGQEIKGLRHDLATEVTRLDIKIDKKVDALRDEMAFWKDEILTSNDKLAQKMNQILIEQQSITVNYRRLDFKNEKIENKVYNLESFAEQAAKKLKLDFQKA